MTHTQKSEHFGALAKTNVTKTEVAFHRQKRRLTMIESLHVQGTSQNYYRQSQGVDTELS